MVTKTSKLCPLEAKTFPYKIYFPTSQVTEEINAKLHVNQDAFETFSNLALMIAWKLKRFRAQNENVNKFHFNIDWAPFDWLVPEQVS